VNSNVMVVGIGNESCGDDGIGPLVVRRLGERELPGVRCLVSPADGLALLDDFGGVDTVILVDAALAAGSAATVRRIDAIASPLPGALRQVSSHGFGVLEVVELARAMGRLPGRLIVYGIAGERFSPGDEMSPAVRAAADRVVADIERELLCTN
jgi:hydrogenase maturation protease